MFLQALRCVRAVSARARYACVSVCALVKCACNAELVCGVQGVPLPLCGGAAAVGGLPRTLEFSPQFTYSAVPCTQHCAIIIHTSTS